MDNKKNNINNSFNGDKIDVINTNENNNDIDKNSINRPDGRDISDNFEKSVNTISNSGNDDLDSLNIKTINKNVNNARKIIQVDDDIPMIKTNSSVSRNSSSEIRRNRDLGKKQTPGQRVQNSHRNPEKSGVRYNTNSLNNKSQTEQERREIMRRREELTRDYQVQRNRPQTRPDAKKRQPPKKGAAVPQKQKVQVYRTKQSWEQLLENRKKKKKQNIIILSVAMAILICISIGYVFAKNSSTVEASSLAKPTLPIVTVRFNDEKIAILHGYTSKDMRATLLRDAIVPTQNNNAIPINIDVYNLEVNSIKYTIRSIDNERLISDEEINNYQVVGGQISAEIQVSDIIEPNVEYMVQIVLNVSGSGNNARDIYYYTRMKSYQDSELENILNIIKNFSESTFTKENVEENVSAYLGKNTSSDDDYGHVTQNSSTDMVCWGDLVIEREADPKLTIYEFSESQVMAALEYNVKVAQEEFEVREEFCFRFRNNKYYLMRYDRTMDYIFLQSSATIDDAGNQIYLGIRSNSDVDMLTDDANIAFAFVNNEQLWLYNTRTETLSRIFTFEDDDYDIRAAYNQHDVRLVDVDSLGNVDFLVYGYMNRGDHEGEVGISYYRYNSDTKLLTELFYIERDVSYQILREEIGDLLYRSEDDRFYFEYNNVIYRILLQDGISEALVPSVDTMECVSNDDNKLFAYNTDRNTITILNLETGTSNIISASGDDFVRILGYINSDFIYGVGKNADRSTGLLYKLNIINSDMVEQGTYEKQDVYVTGVDIGESRIMVYRKLMQNGTLIDVNDDAITLNNSVVNTKLLRLNTINTSQKNEYYIQTNSNVINDVSWNNKMPTIQRLSDYSKVSDTIYQTIKIPAYTNSYMGYLAGEITDVSENLSEVISTVSDSVGVVVNSSQKTVWDNDTRDLIVKVKVPTTKLGSNSASSTLESCIIDVLTFAKADNKSNIREMLDAGDSAADILKDKGMDNVVDLQNSTAVEVKYYLWRGAPVIAVTGDDTGLLLTGYDELSITVFDPSTGESTRMKNNDAVAYFKARGNHFVTYFE